MSVFIPIMNPLRFYNPSELPNFSSIWPLMDNTKQRIQYQKGIYAQKHWYKPFLINTAIDLQFAVNGLSDENITVTEPSGDTVTLIPTDISPTGWTGNTVNKYTFTPDQEGVHTMVFNEESQTSDSFYVVSAERYRKRLIEIQFRNTDNDFGMIFYDEGSIQYTGKTYFTGIIKPVGGSENSTFETDRGVISKTQATPVRDYQLTLTDIHINYKENIDFIFACDYLLINGQEFQNPSSIDVDEKDKLDLIDISVNLRMITNDYYTKNV